jgi:hypothetical protein
MTSRISHYLKNPKVGLKAAATAFMGIENPSLCVDSAFGRIMPDYWFQQLLASYKLGIVSQFVDVLTNKRKHMGVEDKINVAIFNGTKYISQLIHPSSEKPEFGSGGGRRKTKRNKKNRNRKSRKSRK